VVNLDPVTAAPGVPSGCSHHTGICCVDTGPTGSGEVLAPVEFTGLTRKRIVPQTER
jgi:hypothetical protein